MRPQIVKNILTTALCFFTYAIFLGQSVDGSSGPPEPANQRGPQFPIDDSLIILLIAGIAYGAYISYKKYRVKNTAS